MNSIVILTRWSNGRIRDYAIMLSCGTLLSDEAGRVLRYSQKAAAMFTLKLL